MFPARNKHAKLRIKSDNIVRVALNNLVPQRVDFADNFIYLYPKGLIWLFVEQNFTRTGLFYGIRRICP